MAERTRFNVGAVRIVLAALLLGACAAGGPVPSGSDAAPTAGSGERLTASDGSAVATTVWGPEEPKAVILALHGYGDHGQSTFEAAAAYWAKLGIRTIAPDQRGFGRNPSRAKWPGAEALIADAVALSYQTNRQYPCRPVTVLGHSMGGGVVLAAAANGLQADGLVLAAPAIWGGAKLNPFHRLLAWTAALVVPDRRFTGEGVVRIQASDNIEALRALGRDPLYLSPPSAREIMGLVRITDRAAAGAANVSTPALMLLGDKDQIVPTRAVRDVFARLAGETRVIDYAEGWHLLFRDLQAETVWRDVADWALTRKTEPSCG